MTPRNSSPIHLIYFRFCSLVTVNPRGVSPCPNEAAVPARAGVGKAGAGARASVQLLLTLISKEPINAVKEQPPRPLFRVPLARRRSPGPANFGDSARWAGRVGEVSWGHIGGVWTPRAPVAGTSVCAAPPNQRARGGPTPEGFGLAAGCDAAALPLGRPQRTRREGG